MVSLVITVVYTAKYINIVHRFSTEGAYLSTPDEQAASANEYCSIMRLYAVITYLIAINSF